MSEDVDAHVLKRFELCQKLGKGAYGIVFKAIEKVSPNSSFGTVAKFKFEG